MDVFEPAERREGAPVLVFVHGGGFVGGDKARPGTPYYDNVALWAVRNGMVGVNITYRLAPEHVWPAGADDVGLAVGKIRDTIRGHGGDPARVFVFGTSAGAAHVATWIARSRPSENAGLAGAILLSGIYDLRLGALAPNMEAYYGRAPELRRERSSVRGLAACSVPLLVACAEYDQPRFRDQAEALRAARTSCDDSRPIEILLLKGHNHFSGAACLNAASGQFGEALAQFIAENAVPADGSGPVGRESG
jgi:triacylglycerol lipase